jgi:hypothetical protein
MGGATTSEHADINDVLVKSREKFWEKWGKTMDQWRAELANEELPTLIEWNSQWKNWRHP